MEGQQHHHVPSIELWSALLIESADRLPVIFLESLFGLMIIKISFLRVMV